MIITKLMMQKYNVSFYLSFTKTINIFTIFTKIIPVTIKIFLIFAAS